MHCTGRTKTRTEMQVAKKNRGQLRTEAGQRNNNPDEKLLKEKPAENHTSAKRGFTEEVIQQRRLQDPPSFPSVHRSIHLFPLHWLVVFAKSLLHSWAWDRWLPYSFPIWFIGSKRWLIHCLSNWNWFHHGCFKWYIGWSIHSIFIHSLTISLAHSHRECCYKLFVSYNHCSLAKQPRPLW